MPQPPLAILASRVRVEEKRIFAALERRGVSYRHVDTRRLEVDVAAPQPSYAAALSREISHTRALYAARLLEAAGVPTVNTAEVIAVCGDKLLTSVALARAGLPVPRTAVALTPEAALDTIHRIGFPAVVKPLVGSWGRLAALVRDVDSAQAVLEHRAALPSPVHQVIYVQEFVKKPDRDIRVIVVGEEVLGATHRFSRNWRTNVARGARSAPCRVSSDLEHMAVAAARAVGGGVLGVDLIEDLGGRLHVLEVNHTVEFQGFQDAHNDRIDVADKIVGHLMRQVTAP